MKERDEKRTQNPIDKDKITENPSTLPYAHNVGSAIIFPDDKDRIKSVAMSAMVEQTNGQMKQIYDQMELLVKQANKLKERVQISEQIYSAEMGFKPLVGHTYYFYRRDTGKDLLSMIAPDQWGRREGFKTFVAKAKLLADHTWEILD